MCSCVCVCTGAQGAESVWAGVQVGLSSALRWGWSVAPAPYSSGIGLSPRPTVPQPWKASVWLCAMSTASSWGLLSGGRGSGFRTSPHPGPAPPGQTPP